MRFDPVFGTFLSGNGHQISYGGLLAGGNIGTCACWLNEHTIIANVQMNDGVWRVATFDVWNVAAGWVAVDGQGANSLEGAGGRWAGFTPGRGVFGSIIDATAGLSLQITDQRGAAAPDGTLATVASYQEGTGLRLNFPKNADGTDGGFFDIPGVHIARGVQVLNRSQVVWDGGSWGIDLADLGVLSGAQRVRVSNDQTWVSYYSPQWNAVVAHPRGVPQQGRVIAQLAYHHEITSIGGLRVGYSIGVQERPEEAVVVNPLGLDEHGSPLFPLTDLTQVVPADTITPINHPMWLAFYVGDENGTGGWQSDLPKTWPPGNAYLDVMTSAVYRKDGSFLAKYVHGFGSMTVDEVEQKVLSHQPAPVVAFYDARQWPRMPNFPPGTVQLIQARKSKNESWETFESQLDALITQIERERPDHIPGLDAQAYWRDDLETDLSKLAALFSRIAARHPKMVWMTAFSGTGRKNGLWEHPEAIPAWNELFATVTGAPGTGGGGGMYPGIVDNRLVDPGAFFLWMVEGRDPKNYEEDFKEVEPCLWQFGFGSQHRSSCNRSSRQFGPTAECRDARPNLADPNEKCLGVKQVEACWRLTADTVINVEGSNPPIPKEWTWRWGGEGVYLPIAAIAGPIKVPSWKGQSDSGEIGVHIHSFPHTYRRSEVGGLIVTAEFTRPNGTFVNLVEAWLDDGAPRMVFAYKPPNYQTEPPGSWKPGDKDGFYFRTFGWKADRSGTWNLFMRCSVDDGKTWSEVTQGDHTVTVTE